MDTRRLHLLLELSRLGSMRAVAETHGLTTSTVSQQIAALARDSGTALVEPDGRRVRLTPAGRRLADHAVTDPGGRRRRAARPRPGGRAGRHRCGWAGSPPPIRRSLLPVVAELREQPPAGGGRDQRVRAARGLRAPGRRRPRPGARPTTTTSPRRSTGDPRDRRRCGARPGVSACRPTRAPGPRRARRPGRLGAAPVDRELAQHRRRGRRAHAGLAGRLHRRGSATRSTASTWWRT